MLKSIFYLLVSYTIRCPDFSSLDSESQNNVMCRVNEMNENWWPQEEPKIAEAIPRLDYKDLPTVKSKEECSLLCTDFANKMKQPGCCEYRVDEQGNCTWTGANGHPYLANEYRFSHVEYYKVHGASKNTMSVLCSKGKILMHENQNQNAKFDSTFFAVILIDYKFRLYRSFMQ